MGENKRKKINENSLKNLIPFSELPPEKRSEYAKNGALKTNAKIKAKKTLKETINAYLESVNPATGQLFQLDLIESMLNKAILDGDVQAFNTIRDTSGQKPKEDIQAVVMPVINIKGL